MLRAHLSLKKLLNSLVFFLRIYNSWTSLSTSRFRDGSL